MPSSDEPRPALRRDRILAVALALADETGIEAVSMRRVARVLGYEAMSLYTHVTSKDDVLDGILDLVLAEGEVPAATGDWRAAVRGSALSVHAALRRHPWAGPLLMAPSRMRPARLRYMDSLLGRLRGAGFPADSTYHAYHVLDGHIFGFSLWESSHTYSAEQMSGMRAAMTRTITAEDYPHLNEHGAQHFTDGPLHEVSAFELGLDLILDGLERLRPTT
jgi:AcrR family transcriptional regulator